MVFSNKVRFPGSWEKEAAPDFVGVAKITVPETVDPSARPVTCKWPRLKLAIGRGVRRFVARLEKGGAGIGGERLDRGGRGCGDSYEAERQKDHGSMELSMARSGNRFEEETFSDLPS